MKSFWRKIGQAVLCALVASFLIWDVSHTAASGNDGSRFAQNSAATISPQGAFSPTPTPSPAGNPEINAEATINGPNGGHPQFFIIDVENEQATNRYLEGEFGYSDHRSHVTFVTGKIQTVTINGNQGTFTGMATIGGKHRQRVQFTVNVTANQNPATGDTFSISLSNGYSASGNLTSGWMSISQRDPL
jgi:hypothetical protein